MLTQSPPQTKRNFLNISAGVIFSGTQLFIPLAGTMTRENKCFTYSFMVSAGVFSTIGVALWIAAAVLMSDPSDSSK